MKQKNATKTIPIIPCFPNEIFPHNEYVIMIFKISITIKEHRAQYIPLILINFTKSIERTIDVMAEITIEIMLSKFSLKFVFAINTLDISKSKKNKETAVKIHNMIFSQFGIVDLL